MKPQMAQVKHLKVGTMKIEVHSSRAAAGAAAARAVAGALQELKTTRDVIGVIFATGASQVDTLEALTLLGNLPWDRITGFHMDEYVGIFADHPDSFRRLFPQRARNHSANASRCDGLLGRRLIGRTGWFASRCG